MVDYKVYGFDVVSSWVIANTGIWIRHDTMTDGMNKGSTCKEMCSRTGERTMHARRILRKQTNMSSMPKYKQARNVHMQHQANTNDHRRLCTPHHAEVKLWYIKRTPITQQHNSLTCTPTTTWTYKHCHVESCHESCRVVSWVMSATSLLWAILCKSM